MTFSKLSVILAVATHFSLAHTASPVNEGEIWMMTKWTHKLLQLFGLQSDPPPPQIWSMCLIISTAMSVQKKCVYFSKEQSWLFCKQILMNPHLEQELAPYQTDQKMNTLPKWVSDIFWSINKRTWSEKWILNDQKKSAFNQRWKLRNWKQNVHWHQIWMRENRTSLDLIFILIPSPVVDENWVNQHICCIVCLRKMLLHTIF